MTKARDLSKLLSTANGKIAGANLDVSFENISDTGTQGTKVASGTTAQRGSTTGQIRFNTTTGLAEYYTGTEFKVIDTPPTVTVVSPLEVDSTAGGNITFTITGSNFQSGAVTKFIGNDGTEITASTTTVNSGSSISAVIARSSFVNAKEPYDVRVINTSGLSGTLDNQINVDSNPTWSTASGQIGGSIEEGDTVNTSVTATDADGDTIAYSVLSGTLPTGLSLNSSTGAITGTAGSVNGDTTSSFTLRATANSKTADRAFNIIIKEFILDGSTSARAGKTCYHIKNQTFTSATNGLYWIKPDTGSATAFQVYCDMTFDGGGWTLLLDTNTAIPPHASNTDVFSGAVTNGNYTTTARAPLTPVGDAIISAYANNWQGYHQNNRGSNNSGDREYMLQRRETGVTFSYNSKDVIKFTGINWLSSNSGQTNLPASGGNPNAYGYWSSTVNPTFGDGTTYSKSNTYITMSSCYNDTSSCDEWHSTAVRDYSLNQYMFWNSGNQWGHSYGTGSDPTSFNGAVWYNGSSQTYEIDSGDRDIAISHWVRNKGTW